MKNVQLVFVLFSFIFLFGCSSGEKKQTVPVQEAPNEIKAFNASADRLPPVDLGRALPETALGMPKTTGSIGTPKNSEGLELSMARNVYKDGDKELVFKITDSGTLGHTMEYFLLWPSKNVDFENDTYLEKTGTLAGFPSYIKYSKTQQSGEIHIMPAKRYELDLRGKNVSLEEMKSFLNEWDIKNSVEGF